ncbi:hypothetical protein RHS03_06823, partial [Rhizoctonia solani]
MRFIYLIVLATLASASPFSVNRTVERREFIPEPTDAVIVRQYLDELIVAPPFNSERKQFGQWITIDGKCDTRKAILKRDAIDDVILDSDCGIVSGSWRSDYDGKLILDRHARGMDIDHIVPLKEAWVSGAYNWTAERRIEFANDLIRPQLLAVSAQSNRMKGGRDPSKWMPSFREFRCPYVRAWIQVKHFYGLTVDQDEKDALAKLIKNC